MSLSQTIVLILCGCGPMGGAYTGSQCIQTAGGILCWYDRVHSTSYSFILSYPVFWGSKDVGEGAEVILSYPVFWGSKEVGEVGEGAEVSAQTGCKAGKKIPTNHQLIIMTNAIKYIGHACYRSIGGSDDQLIQPFHKILQLFFSLINASVQLFWIPVKAWTFLAFLPFI